MKLIQEANTAISNMQPQSTLDFGVSDIKIIMQVLSSMYSNPISTITQEYICNARDAHREIGQTRPIEITCPTKINPILSVRDFGPGLSDKRIKEIFINYGASTKRQSNKQTGGFGIGSKSAWSYTDSFLVTSYYNGYVSVYNANKSDNIPKMQRLSKKRTKEPNGVKIEISVNPKDIEQFKTAIFKTIHFWETTETPQLTNIPLEEMPTLNDKLFTIEEKDFTYFLTNCEFVQDGSTNLIIDGIIYPLRLNNLGNDIKAYSSHKYRSAFIKLPNGSVTPTPSREEIEYNTNTKNKLIAILSKINAKIHSEFKSEFYKKPYKTAHLYSSSYTDLPSIKDKLVSYDASAWYGKLVISNSKGKYLSFTRKSNLRATEANQFNNSDLYISPSKAHVLLYETSTETLKQKWVVIKQYLLKNNFSQAVLLTDPSKELIEKLDLININTLPYTKVASASKNHTNRPNKELCLHYIGLAGFSAEHKNISEITKVHYYCSTADYETYKDFIRFLLRTDKAPICHIAPSKVKTVENNPLFIHLEQYLKDYKLPDEAYRDYLKECIGKICNVYNLVSLGNYSDNAAKELLFIKQIFAPNYSKYVNNIYEPLIKKDHPLIKTFLELKDRISNITKVCPLLELMRYAEKKHATLIQNYIEQCYSQQA